MNKIKAAIIEDEIPAGRLLHKMLSGLRPDWDIVVLPGSIEGSVKWFQEHPHPDIIFLDIQLTDGISFAFIEQAQPESMIIFTTAYDEYAILARYTAFRLLISGSGYGIFFPDYLYFSVGSVIHWMGSIGWYCHIWQLIFQTFRWLRPIFPCLLVSADSLCCLE